MTLGTTVVKANAKKIRRLYKDSVLAGFAGTAADAFTLIEKFEATLEQYHGNLARAAVELTKEWRSDRVLRRLEAYLIVADRKQSFLLSGNGDVIEPSDGILAIGSGGTYAQAAATALVAHTSRSAAEIVQAAMTIAADLCIYTNREIIIEELSQDVA